VFFYVTTGFQGVVVVVDVVVDCSVLLLTFVLVVGCSFVMIMFWDMLYVYLTLFLFIRSNAFERSVTDNKDSKLGTWPSNQ
jgi:uncharacterized membrane protein